MKPDFPITPLLTGPQRAAPQRTQAKSHRPALMWTVRGGTVLALIDLNSGPTPDGVTCWRSQPRGFLAGRDWPDVTSQRKRGVALLRHEPPAGSSAAVQNAFWADVTAAAHSGAPVVVVTRTLGAAADHARRILVTCGGRVLARASRTELHARLHAECVTARSDTLHRAQVMAIPGVRSVCHVGRELQVTADPHAGVAAALRALDPHARVCTRALTLQDVFQGLDPQLAGPGPTA